MTHQDLTELQIEISELEKENQDLKCRIRELEVNFAYVEQRLLEQTTENKKPKLSVVS